jgi:hypothetical protein
MSRTRINSDFPRSHYPLVGKVGSKPTHSFGSTLRRSFAPPPGSILRRGVGGRNQTWRGVGTQERKDGSA